MKSLTVPTIREIEKLAIERCDLKRGDENEVIGGKE